MTAPKKLELKKSAQEIGETLTEKVNLERTAEALGSANPLIQAQNQIAQIIIVMFAAATIIPLVLFLWRALIGSCFYACPRYTVEEMGIFMNHLTNFALKVFMPIVTLVLGFYYGKK